MQFLKTIRSTTKAQFSWIMYDWANSAYTIVITTAILPIYFKNMADLELTSETSTLLWSIVNTAGALLIALSGPLLGSIADFKGLKKRLFMFFVLLGVGFTFVLALIPFGNWLLILIVYFITILGFAGANVFYDSFLVDTTPKDDMDFISATGFAAGYFGSTIPFVICILLVTNASKLGLDTITATKITFIITGLWWGLFTIPMFKNVQQKYFKPRTSNIIGDGFKSIKDTLKNIMKYKVAFVFLLAYFFYIDGVDTIIKLATVIGTDVGISSTDLLIVLMLTQIVAFPFSILFGYLATKLASKYLIYTAICIYIVICIYAMLHLSTAKDFYIIGFMVGTVQGGIQSLSRSFFSKQIPAERSNEFFGFYNILGKFSTVLGPLLYGLTLFITKSVSIAIASVSLLFVIGLILFIYTNKLISKQENICN